MNNVQEYFNRFFHTKREFTAGDVYRAMVNDGEPVDNFKEQIPTGKKWWTHTRLWVRGGLDQYTFERN